MILHAMAQRIEIWPIEKLIPFANNPRTHSDAQVAQIAASIREFGFNNPILVDTKSGILAGHGRFARRPQAAAYGSSGDRVGSPFRNPEARYQKVLVTNHVKQRDCAYDGLEQLRPLRHSGPDEQAAVRAAANRQL